MIGRWLSRGNAGWVAAAVGFIIILYLIVTDECETDYCEVD